MDATRPKIRKEGLSMITESPNDIVDVVFVHGLNGHPAKTWTGQDDSGNPFFWVAELSSNRTLPPLRALTFGYDARFDAGSRNLLGVRQHAEALLLAIRNKRLGSLSSRPIVFICHSLGGLVVKQALNMSSTKSTYQSIYESTRSIFFFGTPHRGARIEQGTRVSLMEHLAKVAGCAIPPEIRDVLDPRSKELFAINDQYSDIKHDISVVNFYEGRTTHGLSDLVVDFDSAIMHLPGEDKVCLPRTHQELVRYHSSDDDTYITVVETLAENLSRTVVNEGKHLDEMQIACLKSLSFSDAKDPMKSIHDPHRGTFDWLWREETGLERWLCDSHGIFRVTGKAGCGKSTLMKVIYSQIKEKLPATAVTIPFFFKSQGSYLQRSLGGLLRVAVSEIIQHAPAAQSAVRSTFQQKLIASSRGDWSTEADTELEWEIDDLERMLRSLLKQHYTKMKVVFVVDAVDECTDRSVSYFFRLFEDLNDLAEGIVVQVCCSGRELPPGPGFSVVTWNKQDISQYVQFELTSLATPADKQNLDDLGHKIVNAAEGIFLWAVLVTDKLTKAYAKGDTPKKLASIVSETPPELTKLFAKILGNISKDHYELGTQLFGLTLCSQRPLTVAEIRFVLELGQESCTMKTTNSETRNAYVSTDDMMIKIINSRCGGLLEAKQLHSKKTVVQFIHQSVKDFLMDANHEDRKDDFQAFPTARLLEQGHAMLSRSCIRYCNLPELRSLALKPRDVAAEDLDREIKQINERHPFMQYAVDHWLDHCSAAEKLGFPQTTEILRFLEWGGEAFKTWLQSYYTLSLRRTTRDARETTLFSLAIRYNLQDLVRTLLDSSNHDIADPMNQVDRCLQIASVEGHCDLIKLLIDHGADVNSIGGSFHTALQAAAFGGSKEAVKILLDEGADINVTGGDFECALYAAAHEGHREVVEFLISRGAKVTKLGGFFGNPLRAAAEAGSGPVVQLLLESGADALEYDEFGVNILFWAIVSCSEVTVKSLIDVGISTRAYIWPGFTLLHWLSLYGSENDIRAALTKDPGLSQQQLSLVDFNGSTPLHWAACNMREGVLDILLEISPNPSVANNYGITPLHLASAATGVEHVQALCFKEADWTLRDSMGLGVVHYAALNKSVDVLGSYIYSDEEIDAWSPDFYGRTPIHIAAEFGSLRSLELLARCKEGRHLEQPDINGSTILHAAARHLEDDPLNYCLDLGMDPNAVDLVGMTALHHVFAPNTQLPKTSCLPSWLHRFRDQVYDLRESRSRAIRRRGAAQLELGIRRVSEALKPPKQDKVRRNKVEKLLEHGSHVNAQDEMGNTALHLASHAGDLETVKLLLKNDADIDIRNVQNMRPEDTASTDKVRELLAPT